MKVLFITSAYPAGPDDPRGIFIHNLARALREEGVEITVLAPGSPGAQREETRDGVRIVRATYWIPRWQRLATGLWGIVPNLRAQPWLMLQVPALIAALTWEAVRLAAGSDLIHAHWVYPGGIAGLTAAKIRSKPLVLTSHGGDLNLSRRSRPLRVLSAWIARRGEACIGVSHAITKEFRQLGVSEDRIRFVPLGIDASDAPSSNKPSAAFRQYTEFRGLRVVYVGSLIPMKSVHTLLRAIHQLLNHQRDVCCAIVGEGPEGAGLRSLANELQLPVVFAGAEPPPVVAEWIKASQVLVLPSLAEGRGLVLAEALARGIPVVASDIPGVDELAIDGVTGLRFPAGNSHQLAGCLERLMDDPELRARLGKQGAELVQSEALTPRSSARRHIAVYERFTLGIAS